MSENQGGNWLTWKIAVKTDVCGWLTERAQWHTACKNFSFKPPPLWWLMLVNWVVGTAWSIPLICRISACPVRLLRREKKVFYESVHRHAVVGVIFAILPIFVSCMTSGIITSVKDYPAGTADSIVHQVKWVYRCSLTIIMVRICGQSNELW